MNDQFFIMQKKIARNSKGNIFKYSENVKMGNSLEKGNVKKVGSKKCYIAM